MNNIWNSIYLKALAAGAAALLALSVTSCGSSIDVAETYDDSFLYSTKEAPMEPTGDFGFSNGTGDFGGEYESVDEEYDIEEPDSDSAVQSERKIIRTSWADVQTKEYDASLDALKKLCDKYGAYFESSSNYGNRLDYTTERRSEFVIRVPIEEYDAFCAEIGNVGSVVESGEDNTDVTEKYFDVEARLDSAKLREERVLKILENADKLDDVLALEKELADIRYEIETLTGTLRKYDSLISYATFRLSVEEVIEYSAPTTVPKTFGERMSQNFNDGLRDFGLFWQNVAVELSYNVFTIITWIVIIVIIALIIKLCMAKSRKKREKQARLMRERAERINRENEQKANGSVENPGEKK